MHTYTGPNGTTFNFNSDFSGEVIISSVTFPEGRKEIYVAGSDVLQFAYFIMERLIQKAAEDAAPGITRQSGASRLG